MVCVDRTVRQLSCQRYQWVVASLLLAIFLAGMALRLHRLDAKTLWTDEMITAVRAQSEPRSLIGSIASGEGAGVQLPLTYIVTHFFVRLLGDTEFVLRLQAVLFGSLSVLLTYRIGKILFTVRGGLIGAFLLAVNAHHVRYSQEARHYALIVFLALLSLIFLLKALEGKQKSLWIGFILCTSFGLYNHYFAYLLLPAEVVLAAWVIFEEWISFRRQDAHLIERRPSSRLSSPARQAMMFIVSLGLVGMSLLPWIPTLQAQLPRQMSSEAVGVSTESLQASLDLLFGVLASYSGAEGALLLLWLALVMSGLASSEPKYIIMLLLWMGVPFTFLAVAEPAHFVHPRYVLFILPLFLLVVAKGLSTVATLVHRFLRSPRANRRAVALLVSAVGAGILASFNVVSLRRHYAEQRPDWRSAAEYLKENFAPGQLILADGEGYGGVRDGMRVATRLPFYLARYSMEDVPVLPIRRGLSQAVLECPRAGNGEVWAVILHPSSGLDAAELQGEIAVVDFEQVSVIRLREPSENVLQDAVSMLHILRDVLPAPEAHFDVHLALAEISLRTGGFDQAALELDMADRVKPDRPKALQDLTEGRAELKQLSTGVAEAVRNPLWRSLGSKIAFLGYDLYPTFVRPGDSLHLSLYWQSLQTTDAAYTAFTHLLDTGGRIWAQQDNQPHHGERPTSTWLRGEVIRDEYDLRVRADAPAGEYVLEIGMYDGVTGQRLPICDENGERLEYSRILLQSVTVHEP